MKRKKTSSVGHKTRRKSDTRDAGNDILVARFIPLSDISIQNVLFKQKDTHSVRAVCVCVYDTLHT